MALVPDAHSADNRLVPDLVNTKLIYADAGAEYYGLRREVKQVEESVIHMIKGKPEKTLLWIDATGSVKVAKVVRRKVPKQSGGSAIMYQLLKAKGYDSRTIGDAVAASKGLTTHVAADVLEIDCEDDEAGDQVEE